MPEIKRMSAREFRELGLLQEVNRRFLHPLGLALETIIDDDPNVAERFGGVWDYRDDPEGLIFSNDEIVCDKMVQRAAGIDAMIEAKRAVREALMGSVVQPVGAAGVVPTQRTERDAIVAAAGAPE